MRNTKKKRVVSYIPSQQSVYSPADDDPTRLAKVVLHDALRYIFTKRVDISRAKGNYIETKQVSLDYANDVLWVFDDSYGKRVSSQGGLSFRMCCDILDIDANILRVVVKKLQSNINKYNNYILLLYNNINKYNYIYNIL